MDRIYRTRPKQKLKNALFLVLILLILSILVLILSVFICVHPWLQSGFQAASAASARPVSTRASCILVAAEE